MISKLLEKLRRATETFVGPECCEPVGKKGGGQSREDRELELRTIFKKPYQMAGTLDKGERRVLTEGVMGGDRVKIGDEGNKRKAVSAEFEPGGAKVRKGVRLTVKLSPDEKNMERSNVKVDGGKAKMAEGGSLYSEWRDCEVIGEVES